MLNVPSELVVTVRAIPVALFVIVIVALGMIAPLSSVTVPKTVPVGACAYDAVATKISNKENKINTDLLLNIVTPLNSNDFYEIQRTKRNISVKYMSDDNAMSIIGLILLIPGLPS